MYLFYWSSLMMHHTTVLEVSLNGLIPGSQFKWTHSQWVNPLQNKTKSSLMKADSLKRFSMQRILAGYSILKRDYSRCCPSICLVNQKQNKKTPRIVHFKSAQLIDSVLCHFYHVWTARPIIPGFFIIGKMCPQLINLYLDLNSDMWPTEKLQSLPFKVFLCIDL